MAFRSIISNEYIFEEDDSYKNDFEELKSDGKMSDHLLGELGT